MKLNLWEMPEVTGVNRLAPGATPPREPLHLKTATDLCSGNSPETRSLFTQRSNLIFERSQL
jgi:hypothetical protein